jgi:hypothetical protein
MKPDEVKPRGSTNTQGAAEYLDCSESFLNKARCTGGGPPYFKIGAAVRYDYDDLEAYKQSRKRRSTSEQEAA